MTRFDNNQQTQESSKCNNCDNQPNNAEYQENIPQSFSDNTNTATPSGITSLPPLIAQIGEEEQPSKTMETNSTKPSDNNPEPLISESPSSTPVSSSDLNVSNFPLKERNFMPKLRESTSFDPREPLVPRNLVISDNNNGKENKNSQTDLNEDNTIQCNEVSSSNIDVDNMCSEEVESSSTSSSIIKNERLNLRSMRKEKSGDLIGSEEGKIKVSLKFENRHYPLLHNCEFLR